MMSIKDTDLAQMILRMEEDSERRERGELFMLQHAKQLARAVLTYSLFRPMKVPKWSQAPEFAKFVAQHPTGVWVWFEEEPIEYEFGWYVASPHRSAIAGLGDPDKDWPNSLQARPDTTIEEENDEQVHKD